MCIIAYKPAGTAFPSWDIMENCFENNPDGAGFMYADEDGVHVHKGYMSWDSFEEAIKPHVKNSAKYPFVLHFRITTHGGTKPEMTQPFPLSSDAKKLKKLDSHCHIGVAHNGIIPMTSYARKLSDTALFIKDYLTLLINNNPKYYKDSRIADMVEELISSKMCILSNDGHAEILGSGWKEDNGIMYSNNTYSYSKWDNWKGYYKKVDKYDGWWYDDEKADEELQYDWSVYCHYSETNSTELCEGCKNERYCFGY